MKYQTKTKTQQQAETSRNSFVSNKIKTFATKVTVIFFKF